jgi:class 3 adenylate cyclase
VACIRISRWASRVSPGYTALSRTLTPRELADIIGGFEETVSEAVVQRGGRVVKQLDDGAPSAPKTRPARATLR